ncbi:MAG: exosortase E/protease, VPEID-CTERM system [Enterobacterales bacterium]|nr:exosortase E/protease, VPEID-CTERM system [Enterobacterales bacterium]
MSQQRKRTFLLLSSLLLVFEAGLLSLLIDAATVAESELSWLLSNMGHLLRWSIVSVFLFLLLQFLDKTEVNKQAPQLASFSWLRLIIHLAIYALFLPLTLIVFNSAESAPAWLGLLWLLNALLVFITWCYLTWNIASFKSYLLDKRNNVMLAGIGAVLVLVLNVIAFDLWYYLSTIALYGSGLILSLSHEVIILDEVNYYLGLENFVVHIAPVCSGLEGLVIALSTTSIYLFLLRKELKFPMALILLPIAGIISILFNILRITILIIIGEYVSADLAVGGFHSVAGWLAATVVAFLIIFVFSNWSFLRKTEAHKVAQNPSTYNDSALAWASLVPFILFLLTTLVLQMFEYEFDYLYGIKVVVAGIALIYFWRQYQFTKPNKWLEPILAGAIIAILWFFLSPIRPIADAQFSDQLLSLSTLALVAWSLLRLAGSWIVIPIIEELIFRGYILSRLSKQPFSTNKPIAFSWLALIISSALFALIHQALIAGFVAGVIFALVRYRSQGITEVIIAHSVANILVAAIAVSTGQWSLL